MLMLIPLTSRFESIETRNRVHIPASRTCSIPFHGNDVILRNSISGFKQNPEIVLT